MISTIIVYPSSYPDMMIYITFQRKKINTTKGKGTFNFLGEVGGRGFVNL